MQLSYDKVAAARACGIEFPPASPAQVQRLSMQRKVFEIDGQPHLATRDGSFFETAGTLERLIAGELDAQQQADLAAWEAGGTAEPAPAPVPAQAAPEPAEQQDKLEDAKAALRAELERRAAELGIAPGDVFSAPRQQAPADQGARAQAARRHRHQARSQIPWPERRRMVRTGPDAQLAGGAGGGRPRARGIPDPRLGARGRCQP